MTRGSLGAGLCLLSLAGSAEAATPYALAHASLEYLPLTNATSHQPVAVDPARGFDPWDEGFVAITLPFAFEYFGSPRSQLYVHTNGLISFQPFLPSGPAILLPASSVPNAGNPIHDFIAPAWVDLDGRNGGAIRSQVLGQAPRRALVIEWSGFQQFVPGQSSALNLQLYLYEGSSHFAIAYGPNFGIHDATSAYEDPNGIEGGPLFTDALGCGVSCPCDPRTCGSLAWGPADRWVELLVTDRAELTAALTVPLGAHPGTNLQVGVELANLGPLASGAFRYQLWLSPNTSTTGAVHLGTFDEANVGPGARVFRTQQVLVPPGQGVARIRAIGVIDAEDAVDEALEQNNLVYSPHFGTAPDLAGRLEVAPRAPAQGVLPLTLTLLELGAPSLGPVNVGFYLSTDGRFDALDLALGEQLVTVLDGVPQPISVNLPASVTPSPPDFEIFAVLDSDQLVTELDEQNNLLRSLGSVTIDGPDLEVELSGPPLAFRGLEWPAVVTVRNVGALPASGFTVCLLSSSNALINLVSDVLLLQSPSFDLDPGAELQWIVGAPIPLGHANGPQYLGAVGDCGLLLSEASESNNIDTLPVVVRDIAPDFRPSGLSTPLEAAAGEPLPYALRITNDGNDQGAAPLRLVLSEDSEIGLGDRALQQGPPFSLVPGAVTSSVGWVTIPGDVPPGGYWIGAWLDPEDTTTEIHEDNNGLAFGPIAITSALSIVSEAPPVARVGAPYAYRLTASPADPAASWSITFAEAPPSSFSFDPATGDLRGDPGVAELGSHPFLARVESRGLVATRAYVLTVAHEEGPLLVISQRVPSAVAGAPYSAQLWAIGGVPPYRWRLIDGALPTGLNLVGSGTLNGTPSQVGAFLLEVEVRDQTDAESSGLIALEVVDPKSNLSITTASLPTARAGEPYQARLAAAGGAPPYTWRLESRLSGMSLDPASGILSGTPTVAQEFGVAISVRDGGGLYDENAFLWSVRPAGALRIVVDDVGLPRGQVGVPYGRGTDGPVQLRTVRLDGAPRVVTWKVAAGGPPPGLSLDADQGLISGTPEVAGVFAFSVQATELGGESVSLPLAIVIAPTVAPVEGGCGCGAVRADGRSGSFAEVCWLLLLSGSVWLRRRRALVVALLLLSSAGAAQAQQIPYRVIDEVVPYQPLPGGQLLGLLDGYTEEIPLPFEVAFYGQLYDTVWVNANGLVTFANPGPGLNFYPPQNPTPVVPNGYVAGLWGDWCASVESVCGGQIFGNRDQGLYYQFDTTPGQGRVTFEFRSLYHFDDGSRLSDLNFQIVLHEGTPSTIDLHYGPMAPGLTWLGQPPNILARIGLERPDGLEGEWIPPCDSAPCSMAQVSALEGHRLRVIADQSDDLSVANVRVPPIGDRGLPMQVSARLVSRAPVPLGPFRYAAELLVGTATIGTGPLAFESEAISLSPFEAREVNFWVPVPADWPLGEHRLAVKIDSDNQVNEASELNNRRISAGAFQVPPQAAELVVESLRPEPREVALGEPLSLVYRVRNQGNLACTFQLRAVLSQNEVISLADPALAPSWWATLGPLQTYTGTVSGVVPRDLAGGAYFGGLLLDPGQQVPELDETNNQGRSNQRVIVSTDGVVLLDDPLPPGTVGQPYLTRLQAVGGTGAYLFQLESGVLPPGLELLRTSGELRGAPLEAGTFRFRVQVNSTDVMVVADMELVVLPADLALRIATRGLPAGERGVDYAAQVVAVGGREPYRWRLSGQLPRGLHFDSSGRIEGVPAEAGPFLLLAQVEDGLAATASVSLALELRAAPNLNVAAVNLPTARIDEAYSEPLRATGGLAPRVWRSLSPLPIGLAITEDGFVAGIPRRAGRYSLRVEVEDGEGTRDDNQVLLVVEAQGGLTIGPEILPLAHPFEAYRARLTVSGGAPPYTWDPLFDGLAPFGLTATVSEGGATLDIVGAPELEGVWAFTARVTDEKGRRAERTLAIVSELPLPPPIDEGCSCRGTPGLRASARDGRWDLGLWLLGILGFGIGGFGACLGRRPSRQSGASGIGSRLFGSLGGVGRTAGQLARRGSPPDGRWAGRHGKNSPGSGADRR